MRRIPNAAKLWMEYLYSDEGPARLARRATATRSASTTSRSTASIPQELLDKLPPAAAYAKARVPDARRAGAAKDAITKNWDGRRRQRPVADASSREAAAPANPARPAASGPRWHSSIQSRRPPLLSGSAACASPLAWLGVAPFFSSPLLFLILPTLYLVVGAFQDADGSFTLGNLANLFTPSILTPTGSRSSSGRLRRSARVRLLMRSPIRGGLPAWIRSTVMTFSGVASNFRRRAAGLRLPRDARADSASSPRCSVILGVNIYAPASTC
jgi:hypothetical protein